MAEQRLRIPDSIVHLLHEGRALCGKPGVPGEWGPGHQWVSTSSDDYGPRWKANCAGCVTTAQLDSPDTSLPWFLGAARVGLIEPGVGSPERRRETADMLDRLMPYVAALIELGRRYPEELQALMPPSKDVQA